MPEHVRVYFIIKTTLNPSESAWLSLVQQEITKPLASAIITAARASQNFISASKRSYGTGYIRKWTLGGFEVDGEQVAAITALLNAQAIVRGVSGVLKQKFEGVLQAELREAAVDLGYTVPQSQTMTVTMVNGNGSFERYAAIAMVQAELVANAAIWYAGG